MGEVDVGFLRDAGEIETLVVAVAGETVTAAAAVGRDQGDDALAQPAAFNVTLDGGGRVVGQRLGAREKKDAGRTGDVVEGPEDGVAGDEVEAFTQGPHVAEDVFTDEAHHFPERVAGGELGGEGEAAEKRAVDGGVEFADDVAFDAEPAGGVHGASAVEPFGGF